MSDDELMKKYPVPPEIVEMANWTLIKGWPAPRTAAVGVAQMQEILTKLKADQVATIAAIEEEANLEIQNHLWDDMRQINREIADYEKRLAEYQTQVDGLN